MVLHARVLNVILKGGLQLRQLLLRLRIDVLSLPVVGHLDILEAVLWGNLLVLGRETHAGTLGGGHLNERRRGGGGRSLRFRAQAVLLQLRQSHRLVVVFAAPSMRLCPWCLRVMGVIMTSVVRATDSERKFEVLRRR